MASTRESLESSKNPLVTSVCEGWRKYGSIIDIRKGVQPLIVVLLKNFHGTPNHGELFLRDPVFADNYISHQEAVYGGMREMCRRFFSENIGENNIHFLSEGILNSLDLKEGEISHFQRIRAFDHHLSVDRPAALEALRKDIEQHPFAIQDLMGTQRFVAQCIGRAEHLLLPGQPPEGRVGDSIRGVVEEDIRRLAEKVRSAFKATGKLSFQMPELEEVAAGWRNIRLEDHRQFHFHIQKELRPLTARPTVAVVATGGDHVNKGLKFRPPPAPLEDYFPHVTTIVVEAMGYEKFEHIDTAGVSPFEARVENVAKQVYLLLQSEP